MSRKDGAMAAKHAHMLRELIKKPENKMCADCKKNDTRWASWNIGVFVCIRCSGIHRGMGVHISRVKSVDLDTWGEREMESIMKWGNHRANLYWEAHLRPGHIPPDHKMESFIRSKYEAGKWAREGPPPEDPSVLESSEGAASSAIPIASPSPPPVQVQAKTQPSVAHSRTFSLPRTTRQPQGHQLLSATAAGRASLAQPTPTAAAPTTSTNAADQPKAPQDDLFSLDFHSPPPGSDSRSASIDLPKKDVKQDILSLFGKPTAAAPVQQADPFAAWGATTQQHAPQPTSMAGTNGTGMWGVQSGWNAHTQQSPPAFAAQQPSNVWAWNAPSAASPTTQPQQPMQGVFEGQTVWGAPNSQQSAGSTTSNDLFGSTFSSTTTSTAKKADDPFGDIWGDFK